MILITGGAYQGKSQVAKKIFMEKNTMAFAKSQSEKSLEEYERFQKKTLSEKKELKIAKGESASFEQLQQADIMEHFHLWIRKLLIEGKNPYPLMEELLKKNPEIIIELTQLGCGIVPIEAFDRKYRELVGRTGCYLAQNAQAVYFVNCGLVQRLK